MRGEHVDALLDELACLPAPIGAPITAAWHATEDLLDLLATARTQPDREPVRDLLHRFYQRCADAGVPELERLAGTSRPGGQKSWRSCVPESPTPDQKGLIASSRPSHATPTASATPSSSDYAPEPPPPAKTHGHLDPR
jgi:transposase